VKSAAVVGVIALAVALQLALARFTVGGRWVFDLVLVAVVYVSLRWGPTAGVLGGSLGGLLQDALAGTTIGVGGLTKTVVGFATGVIGSQFIVSRPLPRMLLVAGATIVARLLVLGLFGLIDLRWPDVSWLAMLSETALNSLAAFVLYQGSESLPGLLRRGPARRSSFGKRKW
jgi:rod shape-determining protein MreD